jgi:hypothetical protein
MTPPSDGGAHRGPAPGDRDRFAPARVGPLRVAVRELSWLLGGGYPPDAALALVGNRHALDARQRKAVRRAACDDATRERRRARRTRRLAGEEIDVDGFNQLIVGESALSGAPVFGGRDGALRDLASVHGTWRRVSETRDVVAAFGRIFERSGAAHVRWLLDRPVSNSGRLKLLLLETADAEGYPWSVELHDDPDRVLAESKAVVASCDAWVLDHCERWSDLPATLVAEHPGTWLVDLSD